MLAVTDTTLAQGLERLVMPGRLIAGHAEIEGECAACHGDDSSTDTLDRRCVACHEEVGADRDTGSGFHGKFDAARQSDCIACHTDHEGRDADIVPDEAGFFSHEDSDFPLQGAHVSVSCGDCHAPDEPRRAASTACASCHSDDDPHGGNLGEDCASCHTPTDWAETVFRHDAVGYPLTGGHAEVACVDCHGGNEFAGTPTDCASCHAIDDVHAGGNGPACQDCHTTSSWASIGFDHARETGFALVDGHGGLNCRDCHTREDFRDGLDSACAQCHLSDDDHQGVNGTECGSCHIPTRWSESRFDHADTSFVLHDAHAEVTCSACHKEPTSVALPHDCGGCHALDDGHAGQLGADCGTCHMQTEWHADIAFDHDLADFPLTGMHAVTACDGCHESARFLDAPDDCASCHTDDDVHQGTLGDGCGSCHTSNDWAVAVFDHDTQTDFPLDGAHADVTCASCHGGPGSSLSDVPSSCGGCHRTDDVHAGQFGNDCGACHNSVAFDEIERL